MIVSSKRGRGRLWKTDGKNFDVVRRCFSFLTELPLKKKETSVLEPLRLFVHNLLSRIRALPASFRFLNFSTSTLILLLLQNRRQLLGHACCSHAKLPKIKVTQKLLETRTSPNQASENTHPHTVLRAVAPSGVYSAPAVPHMLTCFSSDLSLFLIAFLLARRRCSASHAAMMQTQHCTCRLTP
jgi:hypothetical protein